MREYHGRIPNPTVAARVGPPRCPQVSDEPADPDGDRPAADRVDARQLAFVALAFVALVVAAFLAPAVAVPGARGAGGPGTDTSVDDAEAGQSGDGPSFRWIEWLRWLLPEGDGGPTEDPRCDIVLSPPPEPGAEVTVTVHYEDGPLADAPVWIEDEFVGHTDDSGQVAAEVPYVKELSIRVGVEGAPDCRAHTDRVGAWAAADSLTAPAVVADADSLTAPSSIGGADAPPALAAVTDAAAATMPATLGGVAAAQSGNASVSYDVNGEMELDVDGEPYPGETLRLRATINDRPVPDAAVTLDGDRVATTDDDGTAAVTVPDDGREEVVVGASRGEFAASETVEVLLLEADLTAPHLAVVPGADAAVVATFANRSAPGAVVSVEGERLGRTDGAGHLDLVLPADPTATVRVQARGQTATTSVVDVYAVPAALVALLVAVAAGLAYWRRDARAAGAVVTGSAGLLATLAAVAVVDAFYGATARNALLVALLVVVVLAGLYARRDAVASGGRATAGLLARLRALFGRVVAAVRGRSLRALLAAARERLLAAARWIATALGDAVDGIRREVRDLLSRLRTLPRSVSGFLALAVARARSALAAPLEAVRSSSRHVAALVGAAVALAGGYALEGWRGFGTVAAALVVAWLLAKRVLEDDATDGTADGGGSPGPGATTAPGPADGAALRERSFRELWRAFARLVVPGRWRTSTPEEVARAAVAQGYPRGPVEELTDLFREVEYGGRTLSAAVRDRAADAYERLRRGGEEG
jgi:hypothetical protein